MQKLKMETLGYVGWHMMHMLKCMLENDVFASVKPNKIKKIKR